MLGGQQVARAQRSAQAPQAPMTEKEVVQLIRKNKKDLQRVAAAVAERTVDFDLDPKIEKALLKAGADDQVLQEIWKASPAGKAAAKAVLTSPTGVTLEATPQEAQAFQMLETELDPDRQLQMCQQFEKQYPDSQLLPYVYTRAAKAYQTKGDFEKLLEYGEKSLERDPDNVVSLILVSLTLAQPRMLKGGADKKAKNLAEAEADVNRALGLLDKVPQQPHETNEQFRARKAALAADAHFALGSVRLLRDENAGAEDEYQKAIASSAAPNPQYYFRLGEAYEADHKVKEAIAAFTKAAELGRGTVLETYANQELKALHEEK
jgi:tetratricopeptide (TPR) repeat protein